MAKQIDVLVIDDDKFVQKVIRKAIEGAGLSCRMANDGEAGIDEALRVPPDIILLDVEMPGINGYEVCDRLRNLPEIRQTPIVFLSSLSSLRERLQGYEAGGDDYLTKPFEQENLLARINVLLKYTEERKELQAQYQLAQETAMIAMTGTSELGLAMEFLERSLTYQTFGDVAQGLFETTDRLSLDCCLLVKADEQQSWYSSGGTISPLEKELIEMSDQSSRFLDFGQRTLVNYPNASLLVKNMPLDDMQRYGQVKDLLPILLSAVNTKINALNTQNALINQSADLLKSYVMIRKHFYGLATTLVENRDKTKSLMQNMVHEISYDLLRLGLEEDQEELLLQRFDSGVEGLMQQMESGPELASTIKLILEQLKVNNEKQELLLETFTSSLARESVETSTELSDDIELF